MDVTLEAPFKSSPHYNCGWRRRKNQDLLLPRELVRRPLWKRIKTGKKILGRQHKTLNASYVKTSAEDFSVIPKKFALMPPPPSILYLGSIESRYWWLLWDAGWKQGPRLRRGRSRVRRGGGVILHGYAIRPSVGRSGRTDTVRWTSFLFHFLRVDFPPFSPLQDLL